MSTWELPDNWRWQPLSSIARDTDRRNPGQNPEVPFQYIEISSVDPDTGEIMLDQVQTILGSQAPSRARKVVHAGDVILATTRPYLRNIAIVPHELDNQICSTGFCVIRSRDGISIPEYIYFAARSNFFINQLIPKQRGANYPAVTDSDVFQTEIPVPFPDDPVHSLRIQRRIVARIEALLAEVREMRELNEGISADTRRLMDAVLEDVYKDEFDELPEGWERLLFPEICEINPRRPPITRNANAKTSFVPMASVNDLLGEITDIQVRPYNNIRTGYTYFEENDILFAKITPSMENGKCAIARGLIDGIGFGSTEFHVLRAKNGVMPEWIYHYIRRTKFRREAKQNFRGAVGQQRVPQEFLEAHTIPIPYPNDPNLSLQLQRKLVNHIEIMKKEIFELLGTVEEYKSLFTRMEQSILAQAFRGEL